MLKGVVVAAAAAAAAAEEEEEEMESDIVVCVIGFSLLAFGLCRTRQADKKRGEILLTD